MDNFWYRDDNNRAELARIRANARTAVDVMKDLAAMITHVIESNNLKRMNWIAKPSR
jgi:hypothetical protein